MTDDRIINEIDFWYYHKDVNVFYIRRRVKLENWSSEKIREVVKHV